MPGAIRPRNERLPPGSSGPRDASPLPPPGRKDGVRSELESPPPRHRGLRAQTDMAVVPGIGTDWGSRGRAGGRRGGKRQNSKLREGNQQSPGGPPPCLLSARPTPESCSWSTHPKTWPFRNRCRGQHTRPLSCCEGIATHALSDEGVIPRHPYPSHLPLDSSPRRSSCRENSTQSDSSLRVKGRGLACA